PDRAITRLEIAVQAVRALGKESEASQYAAQGDQFIDAAEWSASEWQRNFIGASAALGIIGGYPDGSFRPARNATRAEAVVMIHRALAARQ
ncbi:MAG: S-layer homology domain-containing protein, partial [Thermaerobacterales bacterium]